MSDQETVQRLFTNTEFDNAVIQDLPLYDSLKNLLISNLDTIFVFRNDQHVNTHRDSSKSTASGPGSYNFYCNYGDTTRMINGKLTNKKSEDDISPEIIPAYIYPSIEQIIKKLGWVKIERFSLWKDSTVEIRINSLNLRSRNIVVTHTLTWKKTHIPGDDPDFLEKDSLIAPGWRYYISVFIPKKDE